MRIPAVVIVLAMGAWVALGGAPDDDGDGVPNDLDCRPNDGSVWAPPGQSIDDLVLSRAGSTALLEWGTPADTGGDPGTERYDTYGTFVPYAFGHATGYCVELDDGAVTAADDRPVRPGEVAHYLVRIENDCGPGPIRTDPPPAEPRSLNYLVASNVDDSGPGSLREAIALAQDGDAICIDTSGRIELASGSLTVDKDIAIVGPGAALLTIEALSAGDLVLDLSDSAAACSGVTIDGNELARCLFSVGGAMLDSVTIQNCSWAVERGGSSAAVPATIRDSLIQNSNIGVNQWSGGPLTISSSTISNNRTGIATHYMRQPVTLLSSTLHSNTTGVWTVYSYVPVVVESSTISNNSTGVKLSYEGAVTIQSSTISGNGTGIDFYYYGDATVGNTILNNTRNCLFDPSYDDFDTTGHCIISDTTCGNHTNPGDQIDVDPLLGPLADNGGPTLTSKPLPGSPAIDAGECAGQTHDQRGLPRPVDHPGVPNIADGCDVGAVEKQPSPARPGASANRSAEDQ